MKKTHDYIYYYRGYWSDGGKCRIRIYQEDRQTPVVICSQLPDNGNTSVILLVVVLSTQPIPPATALRDAGLIWIANVVTFAVWYWAIDEGGPGRRHPDAHESEDFQFPQDQDGASGWSPDFADYLFLAFNQSTAFGPTDTSVMSKRAKVLSMTQAFFSLLIIAVVVARATAQ